MRIFRKTLFLMTLFILLFIPAGKSSAKDSSSDSYVPGDVLKLTAKAASETSVKLTWSSASKATEYRVYLVNQKTGKKSRVAVTAKTSCTLKDLKTEQTLCYQVYAFRKVNGEYYHSSQGSPKATVSLSVYTPATVSGLRKASLGDCSVLLKWNAAARATGYRIYQYDSSTDTYKKIATTENLYRKITGLEAGTEYTFVVRAYRSVQSTVRFGKYSDKLTITAKSLDLSSIHGRRYSATVTSTTTATVVATGKKITVKRGTKFYAAAKRTSSTVTGELASGVKIKISGSKLSYGNLYVQKKTYSKSLKEAYVNSKGYTSPTSYLIWINQYTLTVTVFKGSVGEWKQVRTMICCVGRYGKTPTGVYKLCKRDTYCGKPRIYFTWNSSKWWGNSFHCRISSDTRAAVSGGCVRLADADLYYIANNCPMNTTVVSF